MVMTIEQTDLLLNRITINEGMMGGRPTIRGMRFPVQDILEMLYNEMTWDDILEQHPILEQDDIRAALLYSIMNVAKTVTLRAS